MVRNLFLLSLALFWLGCKPDKRVDQDKVKEALKQREIKKVPEADIFAAAQQWGDTISSASQKTLAKNLKQAIKQGGPPHAIEFCNIHAIPLLDSLEKNYEVGIRRASMNVRNPKDKPDSIERILLEAYHYNKKHNEPLKPGVQRVSDSTILYTKPITINNGLCLSCHGTPGKEISAETLEKINNMYPEDNAQGHKMGDIRGMWSINMPVKVIVNEKL